jgi:peptidoglycan/LPS O-acetylase OafA/YrhL
VSSTALAGARPKGLVRNIQGLRAFAALLVVMVHMSLPTVGIDGAFAKDPPLLGFFTHCGLFGVDLFFVISGFIMLTTSWEAFGRPGSGLRFFIRRAIRIYPPYWFALAPIIPVFFFAKNTFMKGHVGVQTGFVQSLLLLPQPGHNLLAVSWSLVWEMIFYTVFAFMLMLNRRYFPLALGAWFLAEVGLHLTLHGSPSFALAFASEPLPIEFIFGVVIGLIYVNKLFRAPSLVGSLGIASILAVWAGVAAGRVDLESFLFARVLLFGVPAFLIVYGAVGLEAVHRISAPDWLVTIGDSSYAIYLWHLGVLVVLRHMIAQLQPSGLGWHLAAITLILGDVLMLGLGVYFFFEKPVTRYLNGKLASLWPTGKPKLAFVSPRMASEAVGE